MPGAWDRRPCPGLSARSGAPGAGAIGERNPDRPQPSVWGSDAFESGRRHDKGYRRGGAGVGDRRARPFRGRRGPSGEAAGFGPDVGRLPAGRRREGGGRVRSIRARLEDPPMSDANWSDDRVSTLSKLWIDGLSASQIANQLGGVTRNAVIGKVHRLGLSGRAKPAGSSIPRERRTNPLPPSNPT